MCDENFEMSFGPYQDLVRCMPEIAKALGASPEDLEVVHEYSIQTEYMNERSLRDRAIAKIGLNGLPFISKHALHQAHLNIGDGIVIYEAKGNPDLKWAYFRVSYGAAYTQEYILVPKGKLFALSRHAIKMSRMASEKNPPLLADGLLEDLVNNTVGFLSKKKEIENYGVKIRRGIILTGEPGNGKTMACRWIQKLCKDKGVDWGVVNGQEIEATFAKGDRLEGLFARHTVTFYDDIDINYLDRKKGDGKIACAILSAMDGVFQADHIVRIFTTNEDLNDIDPAFIRPGRIDRCFTILKPTAKMRRQLVVERWHPEILSYLGDDCLEDLIAKSDGFSFAELESIKSLLVTNKLLGTREWDLDVAFNEFYEGRETFQKKKSSAGFGFMSSSREVTEGRPPY
jgi:cell division protease FtsH